MTAEEYVAGQTGRAEDTAAWVDWLAEHRIDADRRADASRSSRLCAATATRSRSAISTTCR